MFTLEELYGVSREEYCKVTGISPEDLINHLYSEVLMLQRSYAEISALYRESSLSTAQLTYFEKLLHAIDKRIESKKDKIIRIREGK